MDPVLGPARVVFYKMCSVTSPARIGTSGRVVLDRHDTSGKGFRMRLMPLEAAPVTYGG